MPPHSARPPPGWLRPGLALPEGLEAGLIGGSVVAGVYAAWDLWLGQPLRTPSILGNLLLFGHAASTQPTGDTAAAAAYHAFHFAAWTVLGFVASWAFARARSSDLGGWLLSAGVVAALLVLVGLDGRVGGSGLSRVHLWAGGLAGMAAMGAYLAWRHPRRPAGSSGPDQSP